MPLEKSNLDRVLKTSLGEAGYRIVERLEDAGYDTWWVGGSAREILGGHVPVDIDIATAATPEQVKTVFPKANLAAAALGSVRVTQGKHTFEVTTFRKDDKASDGRHPESIVFGTHAEDGERRDFTVNALYLHPISRELFDPHGGEADLREKLVRFIGEPATRIKHDALRILRAVRLRATLDGQYHPDTYAALREHAEFIEILSGQRQLEELEKILAKPRASIALEDLWELGVLERMLPELWACKGIPQPANYHKEGDVWEHAKQCVDYFRPDDDADVRLAALFHDCGKADTFSLKERIRFDHHAEVSSVKAAQALKRLQCPGKRIAKIEWMIKHHMMMGVFTELSDERKAHWYHHPWFADLLRLMWLDIAGTTPSVYDLYDSIVADYHHFLDTHPRPEKALLTGEEVMDILGLPPGEEVGKALQSLHEAQIRKEVNSKEEARAFVKKR